MSKKANHICKNINCPNGIDGEPKHYYACDYCDASNQWRSMACSIECYDAYMQQIVEARSKNEAVDILPNRTDMITDEVKELINTPLEEVKEKTKEDLKEYIDNGNTIAEAINIINAEIDGADENNDTNNIAKTNSTLNHSNSYKNKKKKN